MAMQDIVREALVSQYLWSRKSKRKLERNATEMSAARLTGTLTYYTVIILMPVKGT